MVIDDNIALLYFVVMIVIGDISFQKVFTQDHRPLYRPVQALGLKSQ